MPEDAISVEVLEAHWEMAGIEILRLSVASEGYSAGPETEAGEPDILVIKVSQSIAVALDRELADNSVKFRGLLFAIYQPKSDDAPSLDAEGYEDALREFGRRRAQQELDPRLESLAHAARGLVGSLALIPDRGAEPVEIRRAAQGPPNAST